MAVSVKSPRRSGGIVPLDDQTIVLTYARVSSDEQADEGVSIPAQLGESRRYNGRQECWIAGDEFVDVESGTRADRDHYQRLLQAVRGHALARRRVAVTVAKVDRLGRNLAESIRAWDELKSLGVEVHSVRDGGRMTEMHYNLMAVFAQEESRRIGERVRASWRYFEERGWHRPGRAA
jgi:site-specific DNA recombinase